MSGGFFRGTSADQDTRFSNKQAKLMKSQKFAPELDHLVDTRKVKMDVIRPWIASRVTELIGFEDEVVINFIYGLLDGKEVNGKEVQISITGFMEKNTMKFMKELWTLLLSAQKNESGVPQQFLDAKEEETRKKQAETDRIANEIQKRKEKESREFERERSKKMDVEVETKANNAMEPGSKHMLSKGSRDHAENEKETDTRNGIIGRSSERQKSKSVSRSPGAHGRPSISSDRVRQSPRRPSVTPRQRRSPRDSLSPPRRRSSYSRHRSRSPLRRRSPSPIRRRLRSPIRHKSPSPLSDESLSPVRHRRSPSPVRRRRSPSPLRRRRSPSPLRRRRSPSPVRRRRSPSPVRRRRSPSPVRRRRSPSPIRRRRSRSPVRRRSPSPLHRGSPSPVRCRSPSPIVCTSPFPAGQRNQRSPSTPHARLPSPMQHRSPIISRKRRSPSPYGSSSSSPVRRRSPSPVRSPMEHRRSSMHSPKERLRSQQKSPVLHRSSSSLRPPQRDQKDLRNKLPALSPSPGRPPLRSVSPLRARNRSASEDGRSPSPYESPDKQRKERITHGGSSSPHKPSDRKSHHHSPETSKEHDETENARESGDYNIRSSHKRRMHSSAIDKWKDSPVKVHYKGERSPNRLAGFQTTDSPSPPNSMDSTRKDQEIKIGKSSGKGVDHETLDARKLPTMHKDNEKTRSGSNNFKDSDRSRKSEPVPVLTEKVHHNNGTGTVDSEESDKHKAENREKSKHKRSHRDEVASDDDGSYESEIEERKEAKRRRKEEKKLRKEEKRRRREERRRRREERRAAKLKLKDQDDASSSDDERGGRKGSHPLDGEEMESDQRKLEIELRKKALESLKAKKGISH